MSTSTSQRKSTRRGAGLRPGDIVFSGAARTAGIIILTALGLVALFLIVESIPALTADCFKGIVDGSYDIATVESQAAYPIIDELGIAEVVMENPRITSLQAIAAMAYKTNPRALEYLAYLNRGLTDMRDSGEWSTIIASSLKEASEMSQAE